MKKFGCLVALVGLVMLVVSLGLFATTIVRATEAHKAASADLTIGEALTTDAMTVNTDKACQIAVHLRATSTAIERRTGPEQDAIKYHFPFRYKVLDPEGKELFSEETRLAWDSGTKINREQSTGPQSGTVELQHDFAKFDVPAPGEIRVEAEVGPDTKFAAEAQLLRLEVYDNVSRHTAAVSSAVLLLFAGPVVAFFGLVVFIIGALIGRRQPPAPQSYDPGPPVTYTIEE